MGKRIIVIYKSSTGFTKRYAEMIGEKVECTLLDYRAITEKALSGYDIIIFGSRAHAGMIDGYKHIKSMLQKCTAGKVALFVTGATPNAAEDTINEFWRQNLTGDELKKIPHFYMQSGLCYEKMGFVDKLMMKIFAAMMAKKKDKSSYEKDLGQVISSSYDISSEKYVEPLVAFMKSEL